MTIRRGQTEDLQAAVSLWEQAQTKRKGSEFLAPQFVEMETRRLAQDNSCFLIAEENGEMVGLALYSPAREDSGAGDIIPGLAHISSVAVKPSYWGRGIGRRLMVALMDELMSNGYPLAQLWTQNDNARAIRLYGALGFQATDDEKTFEGEHIRRYVIDLNKNVPPIPPRVTAGSAREDREVALRQAQPSDRDFIERTFLETQRWLIAKLFGWQGEDLERATFDESYDEAHTSIIQIDGEDAGWLTVFREPDRIEIDSIYLAEKQQGAGVGTYLLKQLIQESEALRKPLTLSTAKINPARRLYERLGFVAVDETKFKIFMERQQKTALKRLGSPSGIIIEGITGAGKTHTLKALCTNADFNARWTPYDVFREKETFGEFMGELMKDPDARPEQKFRLLQRVVTTAKGRAQKISPYHFILERAHYSYYALLPDWALSNEFDDMLLSLNAHVFLLWIPPEELKTRSLHRVDRDQWGEGFVAFHGDEAKALARFEEVQELRYDGIKKSSIPHTLIDTSKMDWESYAAQISRGTLK